MPDPRHEIAAKFSPENRYATFGPALKSIHIHGFRGIEDLNVDFQFPIIAISGLNGAGKSTVGQLCLGAYRKPTTVNGIKRFYVRDFSPLLPQIPIRLEQIQQSFMSTTQTIQAILRN